MLTDIEDLDTDDFAECKVKYTLHIGDRLVVVENVPARVSRRTGEQFFAPETTERLWHIVHGDKQPTRVMETAVFDYH